MKVTFILKDLSKHFFENLNAMESDEVKFRHLSDFARGPLSKNCKRKIGSGSFAEGVDLNEIIKSKRGFKTSYKLERRKGYKVATFEVKEK